MQNEKRVGKVKMTKKQLFIKICAALLIISMVVPVVLSAVLPLV